MEKDLSLEFVDSRTPPRATPLGYRAERNGLSFLEIVKKTDFPFYIYTCFVNVFNGFRGFGGCRVSRNTTRLTPADLGTI